jgi:hypothetical protein
LRRFLITEPTKPPSLDVLADGHACAHRATPATGGPGTRQGQSVPPRRRRLGFRLAQRSRRRARVKFTAACHGGIWRRASRHRPPRRRYQDSSMPAAGQARIARSVRSGRSHEGVPQVLVDRLLGHAERAANPDRL